MLTKMEALKWMLQDAGYTYFVLRRDPKYGLELVVVEDIRSAGRPALWPICQDLDIAREGRDVFNHQIKPFANYAEHIGVYKLKKPVVPPFDENKEYDVKIDPNTDEMYFPVKPKKEGKGYTIVGCIEQILALQDAGQEWFKAYDVTTGEMLPQRFKSKSPAATK